MLIQTSNPTRTRNPPRHLHSQPVRYLGPGPRHYSGRFTEQDRHRHQAYVRKPSDLPACLVRHHAQETMVEPTLWILGGLVMNIPETANAKAVSLRNDHYTLRQGSSGDTSGCPPRPTHVIHRYLRCVRPYHSHWPQSCILHCKSDRSSSQECPFQTPASMAPTLNASQRRFIPHALGDPIKLEIRPVRLTGIAYEQCPYIKTKFTHTVHYQEIQV